MVGARQQQAEAKEALEEALAAIHSLEEKVGAGMRENEAAEAARRAAEAQVYLTQCIYESV